MQFHSPENLLRLGRRGLRLYGSLASVIVISFLTGIQLACLLLLALWAARSPVWSPLRCTPFRGLYRRGRTPHFLHF